MNQTPSKNLRKTSESLVVIRTCRERGTTEEVTIEYALQKLEGYWDKGSIFPMLAEGQTLCSPFAEYRIKTKTL